MRPPQVNRAGASSAPRLGPEGWGARQTAGTVKEGEELLPEAGREEATPPASAYLSLIFSQGRCWLSQLESACTCWPARETRQQRQRRAGMSPRATRQKAVEAFYSGSLHSVSACLCSSPAASSFHRSQAAETHLKRKGA